MKLGHGDGHGPNLDDHGSCANCLFSECPLGQKRTNRPELKSTFVRFGPKADKPERNWIVRYVPIGDILNIPTTWGLRRDVTSEKLVLSNPVRPCDGQQ